MMIFYICVILYVRNKKGALSSHSAEINILIQVSLARSFLSTDYLGFAHLLCLRAGNGLVHFFTGLV